jgi:hypothetical protein
MINALIFHKWLMNLHVMCKELMKCMKCDSAGFLGTFYMLEPKFMLMSMLEFYYKIVEFTWEWFK